MTGLYPLLFGIKWMDPNWLLDQFGSAFFWVCLVIIVIECGLFFPFLPGDTLLFAIGLFVSTRDNIVPGPASTDLLVALVLLSLAAFAGNVLGYEIGRCIGPPLYERDGKILKRKYFDQTDAFFDKHGNKALVIGRFVPFVRTYITVVAGVTRMERHRFFLWSGVGAVAWVVSITLPATSSAQLPQPGREHRQGDHRDPGLLGDPDRLRVVEAPPATAPAPEGS